MKRIEIEKKLHAAGATLGDRVIVTERFGRGRTGQRGYTLASYAGNSLHLEDDGKRYVIDYNEIENVEPANAN